MANKAPNTLMDKIVSLSKRRGFIFQSSEIYGGINSCYDYGPLGTELKKNVKDLWWKAMVYEREDVEGVDASILMHPRVWEASGHVEGFSDPMIDCRESKARYRQDKLSVFVPKNGDTETALFAFPEGNPDYIAKKIKKARLNVEEFDVVPLTEMDAASYDRIIGPDTKNAGTLTEPRLFNLMFKTFMGPVESDANIVFLRPETAQGIFVNFHNVREASRQRLPFGIAQIGKAFRNEITPGNFTFRTREFEQMEMQYFVRPGEDEKWFEYWKEQRMKWYDRLGLRKEKLRFHAHGDDELAHYAKAAFDIEYEFPFEWQEIEGVHNRTDFDLARHAEYSKKDMRYFDADAKEKFIPYVIETSIGCDRTVLTCIIDAYAEEEDRVVLKFAPTVAPFKAAVFPLVKKDGMPEVANNIVNELRGDYRVFYDESGSVGRRYRRQDEAGTPYCITVDGDTVESGTVTVRDRDTMEQVRVDKSQIKKFLADKLKG